jgi:pimeloyl-ACP methyl ester carboxylesterase
MREAVFLAFPQGIPLTKSENTLTLSDGRTLAYAEYGDLRGKPVFFFHGMPGSRLFRPPDNITEKAGVRLITTDRPGYGRSTFQPGRRFLDWPDDIVQLADHLGIQKFCVAGHSGSGPYVAACAYALPERVTAAAVLSGAGPVDAPDITRGMTTMNKLGVLVGRFIPWPFWQALVWVFYHRRAENPSREFKRGDGKRPPADEQQFQKPEVREACTISELEAFRPGLQGLVWEARLLTRPWGFPLQDIRVPYHLWHGTEDDQAPLAMARHVAGKIPGSKITVCENEAHMLLFPHWEEILTQLILE